jgi:nitroreductase
MRVEDAVVQRKSTRAFLQAMPSPKEVVEILRLASRAPSGANMQPWRCYIIVGDKREELVQKVAMRLANGTMPDDSSDFNVYPSREIMRLPQNKAMRGRRIKLGADMYAKLGVKRGDTEGQLAALTRNFDFFGAPVGIIVTVDKALDRNGWGHVGCFLQTLCLLAEERGLATCLQEAWSQVESEVVSTLGIDTSREAVWCGVALGYADPAAAVNTLQTERATVHEFATFHGGGFEELQLSKL